jgi:hypothetical protein
VSDIDTAVVDSLKALDPERPIREADMSVCSASVRVQVAKAHGIALRNVRYAQIGGPQLLKAPAAGWHDACAHEKSGLPVHGDC